VRFVAFTLIAIAALRPVSARADADFAGDSDAWNGASTFLSVARETATVATVVDARRVDLDRLGPTDALLVLGPETPLPEEDLVAFVRRGGRLVIADDFGTGGAVFERFGIRRAEPGATNAARVRGEDALLVARPFYAHPLTEGVGVIVTNRPVLLTHPRLVPLVALDDGGPGLVLTGVVGEGRVVAIGDPSIFMNAMMELSGNRRFAANVVRFVTASPPARRLVIATGSARFEGRFDPEASGPIRERLEYRLRELARSRMPDPALRVASVLLALLSIVLLSTMRETRREAAMPWLDSRSAYSGPDDARREALRAAVERAAGRRLGAAAGAEKRALAAAIRTLSLPSADEHRILRALEGHASPSELTAAADTLDTALMRREENAGTAARGTNDRKESR